MIPGRTVPGATTSAAIGIEAYSYWKQNHPESYSQDIDNNIYDLSTTVSDNDLADVINILGNKVYILIFIFTISLTSSILYHFLSRLSTTLEHDQKFLYG